MNFNLQPTLEDDLVILRSLREEDFQNLFKAASDPLIWEQHQNKNRHTIEEFTEFFTEAIASKGAFVIVDKKSRKVVGSSRFKMRNEAEGVVEIGWSFLARECWGGQFNKASKKLMINYALQFCKHIIFYVNVTNYRSQRAVEKLGGRKMKYPEKPWVLKEDIGITYTIDAPLTD